MTGSPPGASDRVRRLVDAASLEEQVALVAGATLWETTANERLGIPAVRLLDGPSGVRGKEFLEHPSLSVPTASALGASWDPALVGEVGRLLGRQVGAKGAHVHLAPTLNLHRSPLGGRNFEAFSEDPWLTAELACAYVDGVQSEGVASCVKHFVGNDTELDRLTVDNHIDETTLREVYLRPFESAVVDAGAGAVMAAYNGVNGATMTEHRALLDGVLRDEWGFAGPVVSDWWGTRSTIAALVAGTDLEMPGPAAQRGAQLVEAVQDGRVERHVVAQAATRLLALYERVGALDGDGPGPDRTLDTDEERMTLRRAAASSMVLLRNTTVGDRPVLPLPEDFAGRLAVIGPNAAVGQFNGGGSAIVRPSHASHPLDALSDRLSGAHVEHAPGCVIDVRRPPIDQRRVSDARVELFRDPDAAGDDQTLPDRVLMVDTSRLLWFDDPFEAGRAPAFSARYRTTFTADRAGEWSFGLISVGDAQLLVDGEVRIDNGDTELPAVAAAGKPELSTTIELAADESFQLEVRLRRRSDGDGLSGLLIGCTEPLPDDPIGEAAAIAGRADTTIVVVGTNGDWESEGRDRDALELPGEQDALVSAVAAVSARTIVVVNAGSPVAMPWLGDVDAVLVSWFAGQELGEALVDVLTGRVEPQGRLATTFPRTIADAPTAGQGPDDGVVRYTEGRLIGHRWYDAHDLEPLFPFGFGIGYAATTITAATASSPFDVVATIANAADRDGVEVVQVYARIVDRTGLPADEPVHRLVGFAKADVPAGGGVDVAVALDPRTYQRWDTDRGEWVDHRRTVELAVGTSSRDTAIRLIVPADRSVADPAD